MTADSAPHWLQLGPAEFDASRMPGARKRQQLWRDGQGTLFFMAVPPKGVKAVPYEPEMPGQVDIFDAIGESAS